MRKLFLFTIALLLASPAAGFAYTITREQKADLARQALEHELNVDALDVMLDSDAKDTELAGETDAPITELEKVAVDAAQNRFIASIIVRNSKKMLEVLEIKGKYIEMTNIPVPASQLMPDEPIQAEDLTEAAVASNLITKRTAIKKEQLIGMVPRRTLAAMKPVAIRDVEAPKVIVKGDTVLVRVANNFMQLTVQGKAMNDAALGEDVRVLNMQSKRTVQGTAAGAQLVEVALLSAPLVTNERRAARLRKTAEQTDATVN